MWGYGASCFYLLRTISSYSEKPTDWNLGYLVALVIGATQSYFLVFDVLHAERQVLQWIVGRVRTRTVSIWSCQYFRNVGFLGS